MENDEGAQAISQPDRRSRWLQSPFSALQFYIPVLLSLVLLPLGLVAVLQTEKAVETTESVYRAGLAARTAEAMRAQRSYINEALGVAHTLSGALGALSLDIDACEALMMRTAREHPTFAFVGWLEIGGTSRCNDKGRPFDFSDDAATARLFGAPEPDLTFLSAGSVSNTPVAVISEPVYAADATFRGFVSISLPLGLLTLTPEISGFDTVDESVIITLGMDGEILSAPGDTDLADELPENFDIDNFFSDRTNVFSSENRMGELREFVLIPIVRDKAYALGSWAPALPSTIGQTVATSLLFPFAVWGVTLIIVFWVMRKFLIQPIWRLRTSILSFADRRTTLRTNVMQDAPRELHEIGAAFETMAGKIIRDEAELEDKLRERELLVREIYHRVKNNMQLMSSIINMQIRATSDTGAVDALRKVQIRLSSLAKFHQDLYQSETLTELRADTLLHDLAHGTFALGEGHESFVDLRLDLAPITVVPDQAGPLALLAGEALTNAAKYATAADGDEAFVSVILAQEPGPGDHIRFEVVNSVAEDTAPDRQGLGSRLMRAFASQLDGVIETERGDGVYRLRIVFEHVDFEPVGEADGADTQSFRNPI